METTPNVSQTSVVKDKEPSLTMMQQPRDGDERVTFGNLLEPHLKEYCPASNLAFNEKVKQMIKEGKTVYHFGFGQAPFPIEEGMVEALKEHAGENAYLPVAGIPELRQELTDFHRRYDHLDKLSPDQFVVGPGSKELIFLLMNVFDGDILVMSPTWTTYKPQSLLAHHNSFVIQSRIEDGWKVTPSAIEKTIAENNIKCYSLMIFCNPDNPTGAAYNESELRELSKVCRRNKIIVLSDEIYGRLHYNQSHQTLAKFYPEGTIISTGFSKWASAGGWRLGYHIYPPELNQLRDAVRSGASHTYSCAPAPMQYAVAKALRNHEAVDSYMKHTARVLQAVSLYCHRELTSVGVKCTKSNAGYYIFPDFEVLRNALKKRGITKCTEMCEAMFNEASVALMAGGPAFLRPSDEFTTRLCYVNFDGGEALRQSRQLGLHVPLGEEFVQTYCKPAYDGIQAIKNWILLQLKEHC